jgi:uncharacterized membrane protein YhhN
MSTPLLAALTLLSAALAIFGGVTAQPWLVYVFKPLTTLLVLAHAWPRGRATPGLRRWVLLGLLFSLLGDVALMWPERGFIVGLLAFLLAHLCYLWAFTRGVRLAAWPWGFVFYALLAGAILSRLWPGVPAELRPPVVAYVLCLATMGAQTAVLWRRQGAALLALGGLLFVISDALLATNKFAGPLPLASLWVLVTYWSAQWCIASWLKKPTCP